MSREMSPEDAVERFLKERKPEVSSSTLQNNRYALTRFIEWAEQSELEDISNLDGFHVHDFKIYRREEDDVNETTLRNNMTALRVFIRWLESTGLIEGDIADKMQMPRPDDDARDERIEEEEAKQVLAYLDKFEYATLRHALFALLWDTGFRLGTVRAIDLEDFHPDEQYVEVVHRPDAETPLKNKAEAEREVNLHEWVTEVVEDYIATNRHDVTDEYGREPLLTSRYGRPAGTNLRAQVNVATQPCRYSDCPHNREESECEAAGVNEKAWKCPSSVSPHTNRRSAITAWLNEGHPKELLSGRMNVGVDTLDKHYDARSKSEKRELRREAFEMDR